MTVGAALGAAAWTARPALGGAGERAPLPTVFRIRADRVVVGRRVHHRLLAEMLDKGLSLATGTASSAEAWQSILRPDDVVGLKFNRCGADGLGTTVALAETLIDSLTAAGFDPSQLVPMEVPEVIYQQRSVTRPDMGWQREETEFASGSDRLAAVLQQVTAIINVPFVKTHNIAGLTCCLKNLSHALVKHPARFHGNHCSPYIADIVAVPQIHSRLRLHLVNALRVVVDGGPQAHDDSIHGAGALYFSTDPVAADAVALEEVNRIRLDRSLPPIERRGGLLDYLQVADQQGLGRSEIADIVFRKAKL